MRLTSFLTDLFEHGRVATSSEAVSADDHQTAGRVLREFERHDRSNWPVGHPEYDEQIGLWSANVLYNACHFVVQRDANPDELARVLMVSPPNPPSPAAHYSADLTLRFLPDVVRMATAASEADPLVNRLLELAARWPLSSVGVRGVHDVDVSVILQDSCLLQVYVDRIIRTVDISRLNHSSVRQLAQASLGLYPDLAPAISAEIQRLDTEEHAA